jgi:zinc-ribbon domain
MFCPKCGQQNPDNGKFCRGCGTDLGNVSNALSAMPVSKSLVDRKGKPISWEGAITKFGTGTAFLAVSIVLSFTRMGQSWWFWMLIPAFTMIASGVAQYVQLKKAEKGLLPYATTESQPNLAAVPHTALPPAQTNWVAPESRYKTGDLVPPSVTDGTTKHLEINSEGDTMTLPKRPL